jgi:DNA-binding MarR family transcriptional regulator
MAAEAISNNMAKTSEKEFAVIKEISNNSGIHQDQRIIAEKTGISLGLTNLIIKRLIKKGYVKALQLNRRKIQYMLTPKGFSEKAKKSYGYTVRTIDLFKSIKEKIQELIVKEYDSGKKEFIVVGDGELVDMIELAFRSASLSDLKYSRFSNIKDINVRGNNSKVIFYSKPYDSRATKTRNNTKNIIDIVTYLAESGICL